MPPKRKPTKPSPKPAAKPKPAEKRGRGRPRFVPTQDHRDLVKAMAGYRMPQDEMCLLVKHADGKPIALPTLRLHFREELDAGFASGKMRVMAATFRNAIGDKDHPGNVTAQIWLGKTLYGMREQVVVEVPPPEPNAEENLLDAARRVAFTLAMGASLAKKAPAPPVKKGQKQPA